MIFVDKRDFFPKLEFTYVENDCMPAEVHCTIYLGHGIIVSISSKTKNTPFYTYRTHFLFICALVEKIDKLYQGFKFHDATHKKHSNQETSVMNIWQINIKMKYNLLSKKKKQTQKKNKPYD